MRIIPGTALILLLAMNLPFSLFAQSLNYPATRKDKVEDNYHGTVIQDPYRWLEDDRSEETTNWVTEQNKVTFDYLSKIPYRQKIKDRLKELWDFPRTSAPFKKGEHFFYYYNNGTQNQSVFYKQKSLSDKGEVLIDPNTLSSDGTTSMGSMGFSKDGKLLAYSVSKAGSDWNEIRVREVATGKDFDDRVEWVKFSGISFYKNGFFYSAYDAPKKGAEYSAKNEYHKVYYHTLGEPQSKDKLIYEDKNKPLRNFGTSVTEDEKYQILYMSESTSGNAFMIKDLSKPDSEFIAVVNDFDSDYSIIGNEDNLLYCFTSYGAPNNRLMVIDANNPARENWKEIIPESNNLLESVSKVGKRLIIKYLVDVSSKLLIADLNGKNMQEVKLPMIGIVEGISADKDLDFFFYSMGSFTQPGSIYKYSYATGNSELHWKPQLKFNPDDYTTKQVFYNSKDGTRIPMFIVHKKGLKMDGNNPCFLYGYGGFNISMVPGFKTERMVFLEQGGIYAVANLRGGGEYGEEWHKAGTLLNKQNVFDDFIAAAEYLIASDYTNKNKLAVHGRSNGGLLIGAVMTQRPDLFKVAIPTVGVLDMLRYHKFTIGWAWATDYGSSEEKVHFDNLMKYSPLHNVKRVNYPATLVTTADHDDRVVPAHSFKFISELQDKATGPNPVLIRIDVNAGHGAGKPISKQIDEFGDMWAFVFYHLGMNF
jgi:prolyl oligopeptidase